MTGIPRWFVGLDLHPAVLAGPHAWHLHGLTAREPYDECLPLLVPASSSADQADAVLDDVMAQLRGHWHQRDTAVHRTGSGLEVVGADTRAAITVGVADPALAPMAPTVAVIEDGWVSVIDRRTAMVEWLSSIRARPTSQDVIDVGTWARPLTALGDRLARAGVQQDVRLLATHNSAQRGIHRVAMAAPGHLDDRAGLRELIPALERIAAPRPPAIRPFAGRGR